MRTVEQVELDLISGGVPQGGQAVAAGALAGAGIGYSARAAIQGALWGARLGVWGEPAGAAVGIIGGAFIGGAIGFFAYEVGDSLTGST